MPAQFSCSSESCFNPTTMRFFALIAALLTPTSAMDYEGGSSSSSIQTPMPRVFAPGPLSRQTQQQKRPSEPAFPPPVHLLDKVPRISFVCNNPEQAQQNPGQAQQNPGQAQANIPQLAQQNPEQRPAQIPEQGQQNQTAQQIPAQAQQAPWQAGTGGTLSN